jgi:hypothetical protein
MTARPDVFSMMVVPSLCCCSSRRRKHDGSDQRDADDQCEVCQHSRTSFLLQLRSTLRSRALVHCTCPLLEADMILSEFYEYTP